MNLKYFLRIIICFSFLQCYSQSSYEPIKTPAVFGGIDELSKFSIRQKLTDNLSRKKPKKTQDQIQGTLIEDPRVIFSTYCGGNGYDCGNSLAVDSHGDVYIVGYTGSTNFPVSDNAIQKTKKNGHDMFIGKFSAAGDRMWLTYFGGNGTDIATECIADKDDNLIVVGKTDSQDFPTTTGVEQDSAQGSIDVVLLKFDPNGNLIWSRYYGGSSGEIGEGIALCANGTDFVITGSTLSREYQGQKGIPITKGTYQDTLATWTYNTSTWNSDAFLAKFTGNGNLIWGTYFGGQQQEAAHSVAIDKYDNICIVGETKSIDNHGTPAFPVTPDAFRKDTCAAEDIIYAQFNLNGTLIYSTLYCGATNNHFDDVQLPGDFATDVKFDNEGNAIFCGYTDSKLFPTTPDAYKPNWDSNDAILVKFSKYNKRVWGTYFGGKVSDPLYNAADLFLSLDIRNNDNIWVVGYTLCKDIQLSTDAILKRNPDSDNPYNLIVKFDDTGYPIWSTVYFTSFCYKIALVSTDNFYITGEQFSSNKFPVTKNAFQFEVDYNNFSYTDYLVHIDLNNTSVIDDRNNLPKISIYPNPANNFIKINFPLNANYSKIIISNLLADKMIVAKIEYYNDNQLIIDISSFPTGVYYLTVFQDFNLYNTIFIKK